MYIFLKGNIKLIKHGALLILRNGIWSFEPPSLMWCTYICTSTTFGCIEITLFNVQTEVEIISAGRLFLDLTAFMEKMKQELLPVV